MDPAYVKSSGRSDTRLVNIKRHTRLDFHSALWKAEDFVYVDDHYTK